MVMSGSTEYFMSQPMRPVGHGESRPFDILALRQGQHLEQFTHFGGRGQCVHRGCLAQIVDRRWIAAFAQALEDATSQQERGLWSVARYLHSRPLSGQRHGSEVDMCGQVGQTWPEKGIRVGMMP